MIAIPQKFQIRQELNNVSYKIEENKCLSFYRSLDYIRSVQKLQLLLYQACDSFGHQAD